MAIPLRNTVYDKVKEANSLTDVELFKILLKEGYALPEDKFNKILLDLEILGLITVVWITKDERRVEVVIVEKEIDKIEAPLGGLIPIFVNLVGSFIATMRLSVNAFLISSNPPTSFHHTFGLST